MSKSIKRYSPAIDENERFLEMSEGACGMYVLAEDYDNLRREIVEKDKRHQEHIDFIIENYDERIRNQVNIINKKNEQIKEMQPCNGTNLNGDWC